MPVEATLSLTVTGRHTTTHDLGTPVLPFALGVSHALTTGTAAGMVDRVFADSRTLIASATEDLDLAGVLTDTFGASITFAKIKAVIVKAAAANTNDVNVSRPATNGVPLFTAVSSGIGVKPGGAFAWFCAGTGVTVTAGTGDLITITNSAGGTSVVYDVIILGTSA